MILEMSLLLRVVPMLSWLGVSLVAGSCPPTADIQSAIAVPWGNASWMVCESMEPGSDVVFLADGRSITVERSAVPLYRSPTWLNFSEDQAL